MAVTPETGRWDELFAARTRGDVGEGIAFVLGFLGRPDLISFAGGFPDPRTFPGDRAATMLAELAETGEATAFQYAPTRAWRARSTRSPAASRPEGRRPADDELLITSGGIEALELLGKAFLDRATPWSSRRRRTWARSWRSGASRPRSRACRWTTDGLDGRTSSSACWRGAAAEAALHDPRPPEPGRREPVGRAPPGAGRAGRRHGVLVVEDVAYRELGFDDGAPPSLWSLAPDAVVQVGDVLEDVLPRRAAGLGGRPGRRSSREMDSGQAEHRPVRGCARPAAAARSTSGAAGSTSRSSKSRALYRRRCERLIAALERTMPEGVSWTRPSGGFFSWLTLPGCDATVLTARAAEAGVGLVPGALFFRRPRRRERPAVVQHGRRDA